MEDKYAQKTQSLEVEKGTENPSKQTNWKDFSYENAEPDVRSDTSPWTGGK